jgi:hypothetical protein
MLNLGQELAVCYAVASQLVPPWLNKDVKDNALLIHGTPKIVLHAPSVM